MRLTKRELGIMARGHASPKVQAIAAELLDLRASAASTRRAWAHSPTDTIGDGVYSMAGGTEVLVSHVGIAHVYRVRRVGKPGDGEIYHHEELRSILFPEPEK